MADDPGGQHAAAAAAIDAALAGGAAGIGVEHYVALGSVVLPAEIEPHAVHPVGPAVDAEHEWILSLGIEVWRLDDPALDAQTVCRAVPDLFDFAELNVLQHAVVNKGKLLGLRLAE